MMQGAKMIYHSEITNALLRQKIRSKEIIFGGNRRLKIYGTLKCKSGKRMQRPKRVFFSSEKEAVENGFRPCGHCMKSAYNSWKNGFVQQ
jgi:methylphosphotriester-DNA--protein-cysteine methyltransferase